jgi:hypothetical protein
VVGSSDKYRLRKRGAAMEREEQRKQLEAILACQGLCDCGRSVLPARDYACRLLARSEYKVLLEQIYRSLGGCGLTCPANVGDRDIVASTFVVEFNEAQHFNRYRRLTLDCTLYGELPLFPLDVYRNFCVKREPECLKKASGGKYWTSPSTETQFGTSDSRGLLGTSGSARWKQRAFYDLLRDLAPLAGGLPVVRISIWDELRADGGSLTVGDALLNRDSDLDQRIIALVCGRAGVGNPPV